jgi:hypothetical protein
MICIPAMIYLVYGIIQIIADLNKGLNNTAFIKFIVVVFFTFVLNTFCSLGLEIVSWILVFLPIILTSFVVAYVLVYLELDEKNGNKKNQESDYLSVSKYYDTYLVI